MTRTIAAMPAILMLLGGAAEAHLNYHGHRLVGVHLRTHHCKRASCLAKHPGGRDVDPIGGGRPRRH